MSQTRNLAVVTAVCVGLSIIAIAVSTGRNESTYLSDAQLQAASEIAKVDSLNTRIRQLNTAVLQHGEKFSAVERQVEELLALARRSHEDKSAKTPEATMAAESPEVVRLRERMLSDLSAIRSSLEAQQVRSTHVQQVPSSIDRSVMSANHFDGHHSVAYVRFNVGLTELINPDQHRTTKDAAALCELFLLSHPSCRMDEGLEGMIGCINRYGFDEWSYSLPRRCTDSDFWRNLRFNATDIVQSRGADSQLRARAKEIRDPLFTTQVYDPRTQPPPPHVPADERTPTPLAFKKCPDGSVVYGTIFGYPKSLFRERPARTKLWDFGQVLPGLVLRGDHLRLQHPLAWNDEYFLHASYRHAFFGFSHYRGGWDCMRHIDILSTGTPAYIPDIENCDEYCLSGYPKDLIREAMNLPGVRHIDRLPKGAAAYNATHWIKESDRKWVDILSPGVIDRTRFNVSQYYDVADRIHQYSKKYLWCGSVVASLLKTMGIEEPRSVLLLQYEDSDFQGFTITCGMSELGLNYTTNLHTKPFRLVHEKLDEPTDMKDGSHAAFDDARIAAGVMNRFNKGAVVGFRLRPPQYHHDNDTVLLERILAREFDVIIFQSGSAHTGQWLSHAAKSVDDPRRVAVIDGGDRANMDRINWALAHGVTVVVRELQDVAPTCGKR